MENRLFLTFAALASLLLPGLPLAAASPWPAAAQAEALELARQAALPLAPAGSRVLVLPGSPDARLKLAPCREARAFWPAGSRPWGSTRVGLRCTDGAVRWQVYLPVTVQVWAAAAVARQPLPAGAVPLADQVDELPVDWAAAPTLPLTAAQALAERVLARPVAAGQTIRQGDLKPRQWFAAGALVQVVARGAGFAVAAEGTALSPGIEGQPARVRTGSGRVLQAQPVGPGRVELAL